MKVDDATPSAEHMLAIASDADIVHARQLARQLAAEAGLSAMDQSRVATAVSELARNVLRYATGGTGAASIALVVNESGQTGLEVVVKDDGPGIADIELAMRPGYTSSNGLGLGLSGTRRLMDEMEIISEPGSGTTVRIKKWKR